MTVTAAQPVFPLSWDEIRSEPYRLLFPLGFILGALGIGVWIPFFSRPQAFPYPGQGHAILQIQGFLLCFVLGFLMTMLPKVLGVSPIGRIQLLLFPPGFIAISVCAWIDSPYAQAGAQILHLLLIGNFLGFILLRWKTRKGTPPSNFVFIPMAMGADIIGTVLRIPVAAGWADGSLLRYSLLLQYQAFPLLLILGIGGFLLPKLFGPAAVDPRVLRNHPGTPLLMPIVMGSGMLASYALEAFLPGPGSGMPGLRSAYLMRAAIWGWFTLGQLRLPWIPRKLPAYLAAARLSLFSMGAGMAMPVFLPAYLIAWEHLIFLSGILWLTLSIASRVMASHGGSPDMLDGYRKQGLAFSVIIVIAVLTRISADFLARGHWLHLACASVLALAAMGIWGRIFLPMILRIPGRPRPSGADLPNNNIRGNITNRVS